MRRLALAAIAITGLTFIAWGVYVNDMGLAAAGAALILTRKLV
jgi:hypothetical protein